MFVLVRDYQHCWSVQRSLNVLVRRASLHATAPVVSPDGKLHPPIKLIKTFITNLQLTKYSLIIIQNIHETCDMDNQFINNARNVPGYSDLVTILR